MNKLFRRHHPEPLEKRSDAFVKRMEESKRPDPQRESDIEALTATPKVLVEDLSDIEANAYQTWWKDLDPFHIGKADNEAVFNFVSGCGLPDHKLEEILALFQDQKQGLTKEQFFAVLRLIAHAQNGRMITRDIIYLGAPLPRFQTQAIDAIIKRTQPTDIAIAHSHDSASNHSNVGSYSSTVSNSALPSWMMPMNKVAGAQSTILPNATLNIPKSYTPTHVSHSRSRSVPYNFLSKIEDNTIDMNQINDESFDLLGKPEPRRPANHSSHVSMDADSLQKMMDTGQSLLLTQSFKPSFVVDDDDDDEHPPTAVNSNQSSNSSKTSTPNNNYNPYLTATQINTNPFETDDSSSTTPTQTPTILPQTPVARITSSLYHQTLNSCMNSLHIPPPPVPPQSTKPAYPKYARRTLF